MKTKNGKKSILGLCLLHFTLFCAVVSAVFFITQQISTSFYEHAFPVIDDVMKYEDELKAEKYKSIPIQKMKRSSFAVFDEDDKIIYVSSADVRQELNEEEIEFVSDTYNGIWFSVMKINNFGNENSGYVIMKTQYDETSKTDRVLEYCFIDNDYNIISGSLFSEKERLTEKEFEILSNGILSNKKNIEKTTFVTDSGEKRTLAFLTSANTQKSYNRAIAKSRLVWVMMVPVLILAVFFETRFFMAHFKKLFRPLDDAVKDYEINRKFDISQSDVPKELETFVYDFTELIEILNYEKNKNEESYKEKQRVFANLSHDLRTPLTSIQGYSRAFLDGMVPEEKKRQYMNAIYDRVIDASDIIDAVYEYSRLEHPDYRTKLEKDDFCEFCKEYGAEKYNDLEFKGFSMEISIPDKKIYCAFDKILITRLFDNLIGNSVKYNDMGTTVYFVLSVNKDESEATVTIADNGKGVPEEVREQVFKPFVVGDEARTKMTGTGLGLTISKSIVNLHNGKIEFVYPPEEPYKTQFNITFSVNTM